MQALQLRSTSSTQHPFLEFLERCCQGQKVSREGAVYKYLFSVSASSFGVRKNNDFFSLVMLKLHCSMMRKDPIALLEF